MKPLTLVQISDLHFGAAPTSADFELPGDKRQQRRREHLAVFQRAAQAAIEEKADCVLVPGDLFNTLEGPDRETLDTLAEAFEALRPIPIIMAPGNHDPFDARGPYSETSRRALGAEPWPDNVRIADAPEFTPFRLPDRPDVVVLARAMVQGAASDARPLAATPVTEDADWRLLCFHGTYEGGAYIPEVEVPWGPFSLEELSRAGAAYAAIGHQHGLQEIRDGSGRLLGAYAGMPFGRSLNKSELGERSFLVVRGDEEGRISVERREADARAVRRIEVDVTGTGDAPSLMTRVEQEARAQGARADDLVYVGASGRWPPESRPAVPPDFLNDSYFHVHCDFRDVERDRDLDALTQEQTTRGQFVREMRQRIHEAHDEGEKRILQDTLSYGLDALEGRDVQPRHAD